MKKWTIKKRACNVKAVAMAATAAAAVATF